MVVLQKSENQVYSDIIRSLRQNFRPEPIQPSPPRSERKVRIRTNRHYRSQLPDDHWKRKVQPPYETECAWILHSSSYSLCLSGGRLFGCAGAGCQYCGLEAKLRGDKQLNLFLIYSIAACYYSYFFNSCINLVMMKSLARVGSYYSMRSVARVA